MDFVAYLREFCRTQGVNFVEQGGDPVHLACSQTKLVSVLRNIVKRRATKGASNQRFTFTAGGTSDFGFCSACGKEADPESYTLTLYDDGPAIDRDLMENLFEKGAGHSDVRFGNSESESSFNQIAKRLHDLGVHLTVSSSHRRTRISIAVPLKLEDSSVPRDQSTSLGTLLVVDDNLTVLTWLSGVLKDCGYSVHCASSANHAIELFHQHLDSIALVISDESMPRMSGSKMIEAMKAVKPALNVILCTGRVSVPSNRYSSREHHLSKPIERIRLLKTVGSMLEPL